MSRWHGCWLIAVWFVLPTAIEAQEPTRIPRATQASDISKANEPLRLIRPGSSGSQGGESSDTTRSQSKGWTTTTASLLFVLALIAGGAFLLNRQGRRLAGWLPEDVVQNLGRRYVDQRQSIQLVRCGSKILVLANSTQHGLSTLAEITDPREVEHITAQCLRTAGKDGSRESGKLTADSANPFAAAAEIPATHIGTARPVVRPSSSGGTHG